MSLNLKEQYGLFINNKWVPASDGGTYEVHSPANGQLLAKAAEATKEDVDAAVVAATKAFETWKKQVLRSVLNIYLKLRML